MHYAKLPSTEGSEKSFLATECFYLVIDCFRLCTPKLLMVPFAIGGGGRSVAMMPLFLVSVALYQHVFTIFFSVQTYVSMGINPSDHS